MAWKQDMNLNPTGKGGFRDNPQNRSSGHWKKADSPRYKLEQMMKLSEDELKAISKDKTQPLFEKKLADAILNGDWKTIREMVHEVYGTPKQSVDVTSGGNELKPTLVQFVYGPDDSTNTDRV